MTKILIFLKDHITGCLAIASVYLYLCTYAYEKGYLNQFDIDPGYINITIDTIVYDGSQVFTPITSALIFYFVIESSLREYKRRNWMIALYLRCMQIVIPISFIAITYFPLKLSDIISHTLLIGLGVPSIILIAFLCYVFLSKDGTEGTQDEQSKIAEEETNLKLSILYYFGLPMLLCTFLGGGEAYHKKDFYAFGAKRDFQILIRKYGDELVCLKIDSSSRKLGKRLVLHKISDGTITLKNVRVNTPLFKNQLLLSKQTAKKQRN
jgi:hypothetical protein